MKKPAPHHDILEAPEVASFERPPMLLFLRSLGGLLKGTFRRSHAWSGQQRQAVYEASNLTKWKVLEPFYEITGGVCLIPHWENERGEKLVAHFEARGIRYILIPETKIPWEAWRKIAEALTLRFSRQTFLIAKDYWAYVLRVEAQIENAKLFVCSNDDLPRSQYLNRRLREQGVFVMNVMHGRVYNTPICADALIGFCHSQLHSAPVREPRPQNLLLRVFSDPAANPRAAPPKNVVFFDQPPFALLPESLHAKVTSDLKVLKERFPEIQLWVKPHPSARADQRKVWAENGIAELPGTQAYDMGLTICSTIGWDNYSSGIPTLYLNYESVMGHYKQINAFVPFAVNNTAELLQRFTEWKNDGDKFFRFASELKETLRSETRGALPAGEILTRLGFQQGSPNRK